MNIIALSPKICMSHLLLLETFDSFLFIEGKITTFNTFEIDGFLQKDFFDTPPESSYSRWKDVRDFCFQLIRGKRTPLSFRIVLSLSPEELASFLSSRGLVSSYRPEEIQGLYLNFHYDGTHLTCVTGVSLHTFRMDKSLEREWDRYAGGMLEQMAPGISLDENGWQK
ncbi:DUF5721 family protein [uncultured Merdimonas sp.]|uniref:DUF5721 family protein n=1 Tax=uncultured Merdimonas sp. TaxID=2023269 RepID=UPI0032094684